MIISVEKQRAANAAKGEWLDIGRGAQILISSTVAGDNTDLLARAAEIDASGKYDDAGLAFWMALFETKAKGWKGFKLNLDDKKDAPFTEANWALVYELPQVNRPVLAALQDVYQFSARERDDEAEKN